MAKLRTSRFTNVKEFTIFYDNDESFSDFRKNKIIYNNRRTVDIAAINRVS